MFIWVGRYIQYTDAKMAIHFPRKRIPLNNFKISLADVAKIFERLQQQVCELADMELGRIPKPSDRTPEQFEEDKRAIRAAAYKVTVTILGGDGSSFHDEAVGVFSSPNLPERISGVYISNVAAFQAVSQRRPTSAFELFVDFSKPPLMDSQSPVSAPTPNASNLSIEGERDSWISAVSAAVLDVVGNRRTHRGWVHGAFVYDMGLLFVPIPIAFYACSKMTPLFHAVFPVENSFLLAAAYVYLFFLVVWGYRVFFGYTRWLFPTVELSDNKELPTRHRLVWWAVLLGVLGNIVWDLMRRLAS